jgi:hypothetical protein
MQRNKPLARRDDEVGRFLVVVKWAKSDPIFSLLLEFDPPRLDQADEVGVRFDAFDVSFGYSWHGKIFRLSRPTPHATVHDEAPSAKLGCFFSASGEAPFKVFTAGISSVKPVKSNFTDSKWL